MAFKKTILWWDTIAVNTGLSELIEILNRRRVLLPEDTKYRGGSSFICAPGTAGPVIGGGPAGTTGCVLWLKADALLETNSDGDTISFWVDSSLNGNHALQATSSKRPTFKVNQVNGLPGVEFDSANTDWMNTPGIINPGSGSTLFLVARRTGSHIEHGNFLDFAGSDGTGISATRIYESHGGLGDDGSTGVVTYMGNSFGGLSGVLFVACLAITSVSLMQPYYNGVAGSSFDPDNTIGSGVLSVKVGSDGVNTGNNQIYEILLYNAVLDASGRTAVTNYLRDKWLSDGFPVLTSITVTPNPAVVAPSGSQTFTATGYDQYSASIATGTVTWSTTSGSITSGGVLTAGSTPASGQTVTATVGAISGTASLTVAFGWSPSDKSAGMVLSNGNRTTDGSDGGVVRATVGKSSGKWYWEITPQAGPERDVGIANSTHTLATYCGGTANSWAYYGGDGNKYTNGGGAGYGATFGAGDVIMFALDMDNGKVWFGKNGTWQASGNPAAGTNAAFTGLTGTIYPCIGGGDNGVAIANFGASAFTYTLPSGFSAIGG